MLVLEFERLVNERHVGWTGSETAALQRGLELIYKAMEHNIFHFACFTPADIGMNVS